jgi:tRNA(Arg) A34 adenosine deaminase TadA
MTPDALMRRAIALSMEKMQAGSGGPFGAVIARDGEIIAEGWNEVTSSNDPTAHAEVVAIRRACEALGRFELSDCEIYSSCEPCPMCLAAVYWARLRQLSFGNDRVAAAAIGFDDEFLYREVPKPIADRLIPTTQTLSDEARVAFDAWAAKPDKVAY